MRDQNKADLIETLLFQARRTVRTAQVLCYEDDDDEPENGYVEMARLIEEAATNLSELVRKAAALPYSAASHDDVKIACT